MGQSQSKRHQKDQKILLLGGGVRMDMMPVQELHSRRLTILCQRKPDASPSDHTYSPVPVISILSKQIGTSSASPIWLMCSNPPHVLLW